MPQACLLVLPILVRATLAEDPRHWLQDNASVLVANLLHRLRASDKYGERRGAAFGLAGVVKGFGLPSVKRYKVIEALRAGVDDK